MRLRPDLFALILALLPAGAVAQSLVPADTTPVESAAQDDGGSIVERWQADPTAFFDASEVELEDLVWVARPLVVFADSAADPQFRQQLDLLQGRVGALAARDVILIVDTDPRDPSSVRQSLRPRGFGIVLISKDGKVALRKPVPWDVRELTRNIDKMPIRQQEIRDRGGSTVRDLPPDDVATQ